MVECFDSVDLDVNSVDSVSSSDARPSLQLHTGYFWPGFKLFPAEVWDALNTWKLLHWSPGYLPCPPLPSQTLTSHLQEEILHDVVVISQVTVWQIAGSKDNDGIETFSVVSWERKTQAASVTFSRGRWESWREDALLNLGLGWFLCLCWAPGKCLYLLQASHTVRIASAPGFGYNMHVGFGEGICACHSTELRALPCVVAGICLDFRDGHSLEVLAFSCATGDSSGAGLQRGQVPAGPSSLGMQVLNRGWRSGYSHSWSEPALSLLLFIEALLQWLHVS